MRLQSYGVSEFTDLEKEGAQEEETGAEENTIYVNAVSYTM